MEKGSLLYEIVTERIKVLQEAEDKKYKLYGNWLQSFSFTAWTAKDMQKQQLNTLKQIVERFDTLHKEQEQKQISDSQ